MSKEELLAIDNYCITNNVSKKSRLRELGISKHSYYHFRQKYFPVSDEIMSSSDVGSFIPLNFHSKSSNPTRSSRQKEFEMTKGNALTIEMRTPRGVELRIQGQINVSMLREIIQSS